MSQVAPTPRGTGALPFCGLLAIASCAGAEQHAARPSFPPPRNGIFQDPLPVVKTTYDSLFPSIIETSDLIAYAAKVDGNVDIYVRPIVGGAAVRLTTHSADDTEPELSPDGQRIVWTSQADDVKGDIWVMDADGAHKVQLTDRATYDRAPTWSPDGNTIYFTSRSPGGEGDRLDAINADGRGRHTVIDLGRDPAISRDGRILFYVAADDRRRPRLYAKRLLDGHIAAVTDGAYVEGLPRVAQVRGRTRVLFTRWVDDQSGDGMVDADDPPSLWAFDFDERVFEGGPPTAVQPLTAGEGGEIFASIAGDWMVYTTGVHADLEIYALPLDGIIRAGAGAQAILEAARAQDNPALKRLALRYLVATAPNLAASARYELARELGERGRFTDAIEELNRVIDVAKGDALGAIAEIEVERLRMLIHLHGALVVREQAERRFVAERTRAVEGVAARFPDDMAVQIRARLTLAEADSALGRRDPSVAVFEELTQRADIPAEDGARAADRLGEVYDGLRDVEAVARVSELTLRRFLGERFYARRAADRWVEAARRGVGLSALAGLEQILRTHADLPLVAARAAVALATEQEAQHHETASLAAWRRVATEFAGDRETLAEALITLAEAAERQGNQVEALKAFEQILTEFPERAQLRSRAQRGHTRMAFAKARREENLGDLRAARDSYSRLLDADREMILAHRRFIALSAKLGQLGEALSRYRAAAEANPRDKVARYGYGYALTFVSPPPLRQAEREVAASLALDPRLAAGHLTLGWIREQRERSDSRAGWLERAAASYETARSLLDELADPELYAAAQLNRGNALSALGKTDDAFAAYLSRELVGLPFEDRHTELLFRESFARVAMREGEYDVALDMARLGFALSKQLDGQPRLGTMAGLIAAVALMTGSNEEAVDWYERARQGYADRLDWIRAVPMLRGKALALQALGRYDEALAALEEMLQHLSRGEGPGELRRCWEPGVYESELPINPQNVTRAVCGFSSAQEEEIARAAAAHIVMSRGYTAEARAFQERRLELIRAAAADSRMGPRIRVELMLALNDTARASATASDFAAAQARWVEAIGVAADVIRVAGEAGDVIEVGRRYEDLATMLESVAHLCQLAPPIRTPAILDRLRMLAQQALEAKPPLDGALVQRFGRWLALDLLAQTREPPAVKQDDPESHLMALLAHLDSSIEKLKKAIHYSRAGATPDALPSAIAQHLETYLGVAAPPTPESRSAALRDPPKGWRERFDRALWDKATPSSGPDPEWLLAAIDAFEADPTPRRALERGAFLDAAATLLESRGDVEHAWRLLEKDRLLDLQPSESRLGGSQLGQRWETLRGARTDAARYAGLLKEAPSILRALEAQAATAKEVQTALEGDALLLQAFAPLLHHWHWFAVRDGGVTFLITPPAAAGTLPPKVADQLLRDTDGRMTLLYVDLGELSEVPSWTLALGETRLADRWEVSEALSATYLVAARDARKLGGQEALALGNTGDRRGVTSFPSTVASREQLVSFGSAARLIHVGLDAKLLGSALDAPGQSQVAFATDAHVARENRLDLDRIASLSLSAPLAVSNALPDGTRPARAVAQALLFAGVPTCIVGHNLDAALPLVDAMLDGLGEVRVSKMFREQALIQKADDLRLFGHRGMTAQERVEFAQDSVFRLAVPARAAYDLALKKSESSYWNDAKRLFSELGDAFAFLRRPENATLLQHSTHKLAVAARKALEQTKTDILKKSEADNRKNLTNIYLKLGEVDDAAALKEMMRQAADAEGDKKGAVEATLDLGITLHSGKRYMDAARELQRCSEAAQLLNLPKLKAECLTQLASSLRELIDYNGAIRAYNEAILLYVANEPAKQVEPRRYLGFLYADVLNKYDKALEQFEAALAIAKQYAAGQSTVGLTLDIARVYRTRGEYETALKRAQQAEEQLPALDTVKAVDRKDAIKTRADVALEIAKIYWYRGNYRRALDRQKQALDLARLANDTFREIQAVSLSGLIALNQGELLRAEKAITAALSLSRVAGRRSEEATQLNNLGTVLRQAGRLAEAAEQFRAALKIDEDLGSVEGRAYDLRNLAVALNRQGNYEEGLAKASEALELSRSIGNQYNEVQCLLASGEALEALHDTKSQEAYTQAAQLAQRTAVAEAEWRALYALGRLSEARHDLPAAREMLERSLAVAERLGRGQAETSSENSRDDLYADAIRLAVGANDLPAAYWTMERARSRTILDVLATRTLELPSPRAKGLLDADVRAQDTYIAALRESGPGAEDRLRQADEARKAARQALRSEAPRLSRLFTIDPVPVDKLQARLPEGVTLVSYYVGRTSTTALIVGRSELKAFALPFTYEELLIRTRALRRSLRAFGDVSDSLQGLADGLLKPIATALTNTKTLVVLPHGPMHYVPFAALPFEGAPLLTRMAIAESQSGSILHDQLAQPPRPAVHTVVALAPDSDLFFARLEAMAVAGTNALLGDDATESALRTTTADAVDVAAHGRLDPHDPMASALALKASPPNDGNLEASEIFSFTGIPPLVTLSGCDTEADETQGSEWLGLGSSFLSAGAQTVVASTTRVSDLATAVLMKRFYRLVRSEPTGEALRSAALSVRHYFPHPAHWASFILLGDFR